MSADSDQSSAAGTKVVEVFETDDGGYHKTVVEVKKSAASKPDRGPIEKAAESTPVAPPVEEPEVQETPPPSPPLPEPEEDDDEDDLGFIIPPKPLSAGPQAEAKSKSKKKKKHIPSDPGEQGQVIAQSVVGGFVDVLKARAAKRGGHLLPEDVEALSASFEKQTEKLASSLARTMSMMADASNKTQWDPERVNVFDRVLVKQFSHLLGDDEKAAKNPKVISRRALAGLFSSIRMMCGPERIEQLEQDAYLVMQRVRDDMKDDFEWEVVYDDPRTKHMIRDLCIDIAPHFMELDKRMEWLLSVVNSNLTPPSAPHSPGANWSLSDQGLFLLLEALFEELFSTMDSDMGRLRVTKRYGVDALDLVIELMEVFEKHRG